MQGGNLPGFAGGTAAAARGAPDGVGVSDEGGAGGPSEDDAAAVVPSISHRGAGTNGLGVADGLTDGDADHSHDRLLDGPVADGEVSPPRKRQHV